MEELSNTHEGLIGLFFYSGGIRLLGTLFLARDDAPKPTAVLLHGLPGIEKNCDLIQTIVRSRRFRSSHRARC